MSTAILCWIFAALALAAALMNLAWGNEVWAVYDAGVFGWCVAIGVHFWERSARGKPLTRLQARRLQRGQLVHLLLPKSRRIRLARVRGYALPIL